MIDVTTKDSLQSFFDQWGDIGIKSTGAMLLNYSGVLYNVDGSSTDPAISGQSWTRLLKSYGIKGDCYVTNPTPSGNSHPNFNVGGHMTPNSDGQVDDGAYSYLMPLCSWHNHKSRDGVAFAHDKTLMLRLSGYMQSEIAASFAARLPSEEIHAIIFPDGDNWKTMNLTESQAKRAETGAPPEEVLGCKPDNFVLLERATTDGEDRYFVRKLRLDR